MSARHEKEQIPILMYHSISEYTGKKGKPFMVPPALFAEHMAYLHQHGYSPLTVTQFIQAHTQEGMLPARPVVLTFDDGFADFFTNALPVLRRYGFVATVYIPTAYVNGTSLWVRRKEEDMHLIMTWEQLSEISKYGIECGAHSHSHSQLDILPLALAKEEIVQSKQLLEEHAGLKVASFAYPHGYHSRSIQRLVREAGYTSACAVKCAMSTGDTDPFALARLFIGPATTVSALADLLTRSRVSSALYTRPLRPIWRFVRYLSAPRYTVCKGDC